MKINFYLSILITISTLAGTIPILINPAFASCEDNFIEPSLDTRTYENEQLGFAIAIPHNYRTMRKSNDVIEILNPGTYDLIQCATEAGEMGDIRWRTGALEINAFTLNNPESSLENIVNSIESHLSLNNPQLVNNNGREMLIGSFYDSHYDVDFFVIYFLSPDGQSLVKIDGATDSQVVRDSIVTLKLL